jgi:hypothetical protein
MPDGSTSRGVLHHEHKDLTCTVSSSVGGGWDVSAADPVTDGPLKGSHHRALPLVLRAGIEPRCPGGEGGTKKPPSIAPAEAG